MDSEQICGIACAGLLGGDPRRLGLFSQGPMSCCRPLRPSTKGTGAWELSLSGSRGHFGRRGQVRVRKAFDAMSVLLLACLGLPVRVLSHSYLALPPSRNLLANLDGLEDCPHCLQSGGPDNVKARGEGVWPTRLAPGSHGLCGDPVQGQSNPLRLQDETYLKAGVVTATYAPGQVVEFQVAVSTHHQGHYEFRICDKPLDAASLTSAAEGQACLDQWLLQRAPPLDDCVVNDPRGDCQPLDPKHPERWYLPPAGSQTQVAGRDFTDSMAPSYPSSSEVHRMRFKIPEGLQCSRHRTKQANATVGP